MKSYTKSRAIISLIVFVAVMAFVVFATVRGFGSNYSGSMSDIALGLDLRGGVSITYQVVGEGNPSQQDMDDTIMKLQNRVEGYSTEAVVYQEGANRITIDIPGKSNAEEVLEELGKPGTLIFCTDTNDVKGSTVMTGDDIESATPGYDNEKNQYIVSLSFKDASVSKFAAATKALAGTGKPLYIIFDDEILSAPTCEEEINSKTCMITGSFTYETASNLASFIRIGALPLELEELRSQVVGATLGSNAIRMSLIAGLIGLAVIVLLMIVVYRMPGFCASLALVFYTAAIMFLLAAFNSVITLTLPGIAGIILSIGMAVDANVIIFSRIREELATGASANAAIGAGFNKALSAIVDGNVTTLIAAVVLYAFGSGPVKGFAITLALGIVLSMFTSLVVTRMLVKSFAALGFQKKGWYGVAKERKTIDFIGKKKIFFAASGVLIAIGIIFMVINSVTTKYPFNFSLDFVGGTSTDVTFNETRTIEQLEAEVEPKIAEAIGTTDVTLTPVVGSSEVIIKTPVLSQEQRAKLYDLLEKEFAVDSTKITNENITGTVSTETSIFAIVSVVLAAIAMLIYIFIRFKNIHFAVSSILPLVHDCLVVLAGYAVFRWSVGSTFIACMLTLVGYSINATIVVFDRIRENISLMGEKDLKEVVNRAITDTLGRSVYTSLTTSIMIVALYIFGVTSIKEFALPLMVGIVVGGYSSVCLAGSLWYTFKTASAKKTTAPKKAKASK